MKIFGLVAIVLTCLTSFQAKGQTNSPETKYVSMLQLIATPERFDGKLVSVIGFLTLGRERDRLYVHESDAVHFITENSVSIEVSEQMGAQRSRLNDKYVKMVGVFRVGRDRPFHTGTISSIRDCMIWSDPEAPISKRLREIPGVSQN